MLLGCSPGENKGSRDMLCYSLRVEDSPGNNMLTSLPCRYSNQQLCWNNHYHLQAFWVYWLTATQRVVMASSSLANLNEKEAKLHRTEWGSKAKMEDGGKWWNTKHASPNISYNNSKWIPLSTSYILNTACGASDVLRHFIISYNMLAVFRWQLPLTNSYFQLCFNDPSCLYWSWYEEIGQPQAFWRLCD